MSPVPLTTAARRDPSLLDATDFQSRLPASERRTQFSPESFEVQMSPTDAAAASFVPSADEVIEYHPLFESLAVHVTPESVEVYI
jgi:hypothetical protein